MDDLYEEILKIIRESTELISEKISDAESYLAAFTRTLLSDYSNKGQLEFDETDFKLSKRIKDAVNQAINKSGFITVPASFIPLFDKIEELTKKIVVLSNPNNTFSVGIVDVTQQKKIVIERIVTALSSPDSIKVNITNELQSIIYKSIKGGIRYNDALKVLEPLIEGDAQRGGLLSRYYKTIIKDTLNQWNGTVNREVSAKYGLIDYRYVGPIRTTSRSQCIRWVQNLGGILVKEVIEAEMRKAYKTIRKANSQFQGYSIYKVPTVASFAEVVGGHGCYHGAVPFLASEEEAQKNINKYNALGNAVKVKYTEVRA